MNREEGIKHVLQDGKLPCAVAFQLAEEQGVTPGEIGDLADRLNIRVSNCQLGLFGYGPKAEGKHKIVKPAPTVSNDVAAAIQGRAAGGQIACADLWTVAEALHLSKLQAAAAVEALGLRVATCQLRCF
jgi:hypothetical protein